MIPEIGNLATALALGMAVILAVVPMAGALRGVPQWMAVARPAALAQFAFLALALLALGWSFATHDFSVAYVAQNSALALPMHYRITAIWGGHEGSMLLWVFVMAGWTAAVALFSGSLPRDFRARVLAVMGLVNIGFLLFVLLTSNPFDRLVPVPPDGGDLNPLLQDPGMIIHPPLLYMGYVGVAVAFAFAIAALLGARLDTTWARWARPWVLVAWACLTAGVALGSWWAYYELGWGGWWFWDPVENASFMPWLVTTALIHSLAATEKRGVFKSWTVLLAITAFSLSLLGAFLVRSGVLTSVHAFATDPARGAYILAFLAVIVGGSLLLYALRGPRTLGDGRFEWTSRETMLLGNNVILVVATGTVLLGTLYPLIVDALGLGRLSVGPPYFNAVFVPQMVLLAVLLGIGVVTRWKRDQASRIWQQLRYAAVGSIVLGVALAAMVGYGGFLLGAALGLALAAWLLITSVLALRAQMSGQRGRLQALRRLPAGVHGMTLAHVGLAVTIVGITMTSLYESEDHIRMNPGDGHEMAGYMFYFDGVRNVDGPNYDSQMGEVVVERNDRVVTHLYPEKRHYFSGGEPMTQAGLHYGLTRDLYVSLGEPLGGGAWSLRVYHKPFVRWIWLGALLMVIGGFVSAFDRRYRAHRRQRAASPAPGAAAGAAP